MEVSETKCRIIDSAIELIWQNNYDSVGVSAICKKAKVNKGSFYHFFPSKEILAAEALDEIWTQNQPELDQVFSHQKNPIKRLMDHCDLTLKRQGEMQTKTGFVPGCPFTNIGLDQSSQSKVLSDNAKKGLDRAKKYFVAAVKDAQKSGEINVNNPIKRAEELQTYFLGALIQARIKNDLKYISESKQVFKTLLGVKNKL